MAEQEKIVETQSDEQTKEALKEDNSAEQEKLVAQIKALEADNEQLKKERDEANAMAREATAEIEDEVLEFDRIFNGEADK